MFVVGIVELNIGKKRSFWVSIWAYVNNRSFVGCFTLNIELKLSFNSNRTNLFAIIIGWITARKIKTEVNFNFFLLSVDV